MKQYPTISEKIDRGLQVYVFDKLDGSNIRAEWSKKAGWYKFGTRRRLMDETDEHLGEAKGLILEGFGDDLDTIFRKQRWDRAVAFFEFWGPNSFAGQHADEPHQVTLIDVNPHKKGIEPPRDFLKLFQHLPTPEMLHLGTIGKEVEEQIRNGTLPGMTFEGVVCKGVRKGRHLTMFKIKSRAWLDRLKEWCAGDEHKFQQLR